MLEHRRPTTPLSDMVDLIWSFTGAPPAPHAHERVLPGGTAQVIIALDDRPLLALDPANGLGWQRFPGGVLSGPRSRHHVIEAPGRSALVGILFRPGGLRPFITVPAGALENRHIPLREAWGRSAGLLRLSLLGARTTQCRFDLIEAFLRQRTSPLPAPMVVTRALERFAAHPEEQRIAAVVAGSGLSPRRFIAQFRDQVGLTPKRFCRLLRFQRALRQIAAGRRSWSDVALSCGYFDQPHFNRDFRAFTGLTPRGYRAQIAGHPSHVASA